MTDMSGDELARACADAMYKRDRTAQSLGITIVEVGEGYALMKMTVGPDMVNGHGVGHGGFIFTLADTAFAYACNSRNQSSLAQSCSIDFIQPTREGEELTAMAEQRSQMGRTGLYDITVNRQNGDVIAHFRGRSYTIQGKVIED